MPAKELEKVSLQLQWKYQFQFAGFIVAKENGYYEELGLDVELIEYNNTNTMQELVEGKIDFAINNNIVAYDNKKLLDVSLLATYFQRSPLVIATQPKIKSPLELKGKRLKISVNDYQNSSLTMLLAYFNINSTNTIMVKPTYDVESFISKEDDAITLFRSNELYELNERNVSYNIIDPIDYGFPTNSINLFTSHDKVRNSPQTIERFLEASKKGWEYALENIDEVALIIHKKYQKNKSLELLQYEGLVTKELMLIDLYDIGEINDEFVIKRFHQLRKNQQIGENEKPTSLIYKKTEEKKNALNLTNKEQEWIEENPIVRFSEIEKEPLSIVENNQMRGIFGDYLELVSQKTGLKFEYIPYKTMSDVFEAFKNQTIDMFPGAGASTQATSLGIMSDVYTSYPLIIVTDQEYKFLNSIDKIKDKVIAVPKNHVSANLLKEYYPNTTLLEVETIQEGLFLVESQEAEAFVGHTAVTLHNLTKLGLSDLKIAGTAEFNFDHRYLIQKDKQILLSIINKAIGSLSTYEKKQINSKWIDIKVEQESDLRALLVVIGIFSIVILLIVMRQRTLGKYNKELKSLKERMELALVSSNSGIWDWNIASGELYISPQWKQMLGFKDEELPNVFDTWKNRVHPKDIKKVMSDIEYNIKNKVSYKELTYRLIKKDGSSIWVLSKATTEYNSESKPTRVIGTHLNITEEKAKEFKSIQQAQIIEQIHDSVIATDLDGYITSYNHGSERLLGYTYEEMIGQHVQKIYLQEDSESIKAGFPILIKNGEHHITLRLLCKSQEIIYVDLSLSVLKNEYGKTNGVVGYFQDITQKRLAQEELLKQKDMLRYQAHHDALTKLPNRVLFNDRLEQGIGKAKRENSSLALLFIDLDHFKEINDSLGHAVGDKLLVAVTNILTNTIIEKDTLARLGGDEFTIIIEDLHQAQDVSILAQKIIDVLAQPIVIENNNLYISSSIGISLYPEDGDTCDNLLKYADAAMYKAKEEGRNNFQFYSAEMTELAFERIVMEASIRSALQNDEFEVYYQAQVDGREDKLIGMEALVRWRHPIMGLVSPAKFINLAETTGLIIDLDKLVMKTAINQFMKWKRDKLNPGVISLNLSIKLLYDKNFIETFKTILDDAGCDAGLVELEVVENKIMKNPDEAIRILNQIRDLGVSLAVDDFGTGYSSLSYLKKLPINKLKIDQSFIKELPTDEEDIAISKAIIALAKSLNLNLIAEGVETDAQREFLIENGCVNIQGYFYAKPLSKEGMEKVLEDGNQNIQSSKL